MIIVKIGGGESINLAGIVRDLSGIEEKFIIVHGANALRDSLADELCRSLKVVTSVSGYSSVYTDKDAIDLMMMAYSGLKNKRIVELMQMNGINAVGLTGLDGRIVVGKRNNGIRVMENGKKKILRDLSGKPKTVNVSLLNLLLEHGYTPVLTVPIIDTDGVAVNTENDEIVATLQEALDATDIVQLIEAKGLLRDPGDINSVIKNLNIGDLKEMEENSEGRIKRKLLALSKVVERKNVTVYVSDGRTKTPVLDALNGLGTTIRW